MKAYWQIRNQSGSPPEILLYEQIGEDFFGDGTGAKALAEDVRGFGKVPRIDVRINSPGGNVFEGIAIHNIFRLNEAAIHVFVDGVAGSIASVIAMAGDVVTMPDNTMMFVHNPSGVVMGTAEDMERVAASLGKMKESIITSYTAKTGLEAERVSELMDNETWITAAEAVDMGFADKRVGAVSAENLVRHDFTNLARSVPSSLLSKPAPRPQQTQETVMDLKQLKEEHPELFAQVMKDGAAAATADAEAAVKVAVEEDRKRTANIIAMGDGLGIDAFVRKCADDGMSEAEASAAILAHVKENKAEMFKAIKVDSVDPLPPSNPGQSGTGGGGGPSVVYDQSKSPEENAKAMWEANVEMDGQPVREQFLDEEGLAGWLFAVDNNLVKILTGSASK